MKTKQLPSFGLLAGILLFLLFPISCLAQLSGNYTINPTISAGNTNYQNWESAVGDLISGSRTDGGTAQGSGVSGSVVFTVYDTIYNNVSVEITAITGASSTNTITFKSLRGDSSRCVVRNASSTSNTNDFVLYLNGADYITFKEIGFERTGSNTYSTVVLIADSAQYNRFFQCHLRGRKEPVTTQGFQYGIGSCFYFTGNANNTEIVNSRLLYGFNGIYSTIASSNMLIKGNIIDTSGSSGIYMLSQTNLLIEGNDLRMGDFGYNLGHYTSYGLRIESSPSLRIINNKIRMLAVNCRYVRAVIIASTNSPSSLPALVYNNWVLNSGGTTECSGLAEYQCNYLNFYHNNVLINSPISIGNAYYHYNNYTSTYIRLMNNNFVNKGTGYAIYVPGTNTADLDSVDYNNLYSAGTYIGMWGATNYTSMSDWKSNTGKDANSLNIDPGYQSNSDLHVSNIGINGKAFPMAWVTTDIDGEARDVSTPDIGADEFFPVLRDIGLTSLDSPVVFCSGTHNVKVRFQNYGIDTIKSAQIHWQLNSSTQTTYNWTGNIPPGGTSASITIGSVSFSPNTAYKFKIWSKNPNSLNDGKVSNDTLNITRIPGLTGDYLIGDSLNTDFKSFNDAISAMSARGICGSVTFKVNPGVYNEQITFLPLPGMGANNPIVFKNRTDDSTNVIIDLPTTNSTGSNNATMQLRGANYVTFERITFTRTGSTGFATVIHIIGGSHHNTFRNCQIIGLRLGVANVEANAIWSDQGTDEYNVFKNNYIKFGNYNMLYAGLPNARENGTVIEGNTFDSAYLNSVFISFNDGIMIKNNKFRGVTSSASGNYQLQLLDCDNKITLERNLFTGLNVETSMHLRRCDANSNNPSFLFNNVVLKSTGKAFLIDSCNNQGIYFNTIYYTGNSASNAGIYNVAGGSNGLMIKNNNIYLRGGDVLYIPSGNSVTECNYNNLYSRGNQFAYWGTALSDLTGLKLASGRDQNSMSVDPFFLSTSDFHILNPLMKGSGTRITSILNDYDGELRDTITPDIGADEFKLSDNDAGITELYKPEAGDCAGKLPIEVIIRNFGGDTLESATIKWRVAGNAQTDFAWTGSLLPKQSDTVIIGSFNFLTALNPKFEIWTVSPNTFTDAFQFNDSFIGNRSMRSLPVANAGTDLTTCAGGTITIGPNPLAGMSYVWNDIDAQTQVGTTSRITVSPPIQTAYEMIVTNTTFGCTRRDTIIVNVSPRPIANAGADKTVCFGNSAQIGAAIQTGFVYSWTSVPSGFSSSASNPTVKPNQTTLYILQKAFTSSSCSDLDSVLVTVNLNPTPLITGNSTKCNEASDAYTSISTLGNSYVWTVIGGQILGGQNSSSIQTKWTTPGTGVLSLIETNAAGCKDTATYNVIVNPNPIARFTVNEVCKGETTFFKDSSDDAFTYMWSFGDGALSGQKNPNHKYINAGTYNVSLITLSSAGCKDTALDVSTVNPSPNAGFRYVKSQGMEFTFTDTSSNGGGNIVSWTWDFGDGNLSNTQNPIHTYNSETTYNVTLCVKSDRNCESCKTITIAAVGINDVFNNNKISLFPNPGTGVFNLHANNFMSSITILNLSGQVVSNFMADSESYSFDISNLAQGVYIVQVEIEGKVYRLKLIKT